VVVVTNQPGVARGFFPEELVHRVHQQMTAELAALGAQLHAIYYCPHKDEDDCGCRKPRPGLLERAAREQNIALAGSFLVSDRYLDLEMGHQVGCRTVLVLTGYGRGELEWNRARWPRPPDWIADDLRAAVEIILKEIG
jgi:D-glycero-D-manno-heptose 1,7-bisphosphate phosphatase